MSDRRFRRTRRRVSRSTPIPRPMGSSAQGWLTFQSGNVGQTLSPNAQASITVYANPSPNGQLGAGTYNGTVTVQIGSQSKSVPGPFVGGGGGGSGKVGGRA